jgi:hypothetical protein
MRRVAFDILAAASAAMCRRPAGWSYDHRRGVRSHPVQGRGAPDILLSILLTTPAEMSAVLESAALALERSTGWPARNVSVEQTEGPEDDPDRPPGSWYFLRVSGLPGGARLYSEAKDQPHRDIRLTAESAREAGPILAALRAGFAEHAGPFSWVEPPAFPAEWSRLTSGSAGVLGVRHWVPSGFLLTEHFPDLRFAYAFSPRPQEWVLPPRLKEPRELIAVGPVPPAGETASSLITNPGRVPGADAILSAATVGLARTLPRAERVDSDVGGVLLTTMPPAGSTATVETWAAGPWRVRIGRSARKDDERFQIAVQHMNGGDRALFASSHVEPWQAVSHTVGAAACAPARETAVEMVDRLLAAINAKG